MAESSPRGKQGLKREKGTFAGTNPRLTEEQRRELGALNRMPDDEIDLSDAPESRPGAEWHFFRDRHKFLEKGKRRRSA